MTDWKWDFRQKDSTEQLQTDSEADATHTIKHQFGLFFTRKALKYLIYGLLCDRV